MPGWTQILLQHPAGRFGLTMLGQRVSRIDVQHFKTTSLHWLCRQMRTPGVDDFRVLQPGRGHKAGVLALRVEQAQGVKAVVCWELARQIAQRLVAGKQQRVLTAVFWSSSDWSIVLRQFACMMSKNSQTRSAVTTCQKPDAVSKRQMRYSLRLKSRSQTNMQCSPALYPIQKI